MYKTLLLTSVLVFSVSFGNSQNSRFDKDERAIQQVIEDESKYFWARDFKNWQKQWIHKPYVVWSAASDAGVRQYHGWKAWEKEVMGLFAESPDPMPYDNVVKKENYVFRIYENGAWVSFEQFNEGIHSYETRIMEKNGGKWRIAAVQLFYDANED